MQVLSHTFTYFSTWSPWTLRHLSYRDTSLLILPRTRRQPGYSTSPRQRAAGPHHLHVVYQQGATVLHFDVFVRLFRTTAEANSHVALF